MKPIFISYKRANKKEVFDLVKKIENRLKVKCWVDLDGIESNVQFASKICNAIDDSKVVLFMHSSVHLTIDFEEDYTIKELNYAKNTNKKVILVKLDDSPLKNVFLLEFGSKNYRDSRDNDQFERLLSDISKYVKTSDSEPNYVLNRNHSNEDSSELNDRGLAYFYGNGVPQDYTQAVKLFRKAAYQGHVNAQYNLGYAYYYGQGVQQDYNEAVKWFRKAAVQGDSCAQISLGHVYFSGTAVQQDYTEAVKWYRKAAAQDDAGAQAQLGHAYYYGHGVQQDYNEAVKWYRKAEAKENSEAQCGLGCAYYYGYGVKQDYSKSVKFFQKASDKGNTYAQYNLGLCYEFGNGVPKNFSKAEIYYRKAAEQGNEDAINALKRFKY